MPWWRENTFVYCSKKCMNNNLSKILFGKNNPFYGKKHTEETKQINREKHKGKIGYWTGKKRPPISNETRIKLKASNKNATPPHFLREKSSNWKGGITPINKRIRNSLKFIIWRNKVFKRDCWTCQKCYYISRKLQAHHLYNFSQYKSKRFIIKNGITLCNNCHFDFHKIYGKRDNNENQFYQWAKGTK